MLDFFTVSHSTDGETVCRINVEPHKRELSATVTVKRRIVLIVDQNDPAFRSVSGSEWLDVGFWERRASDIAKAQSPFWRGETAR